MGGVPESAPGEGDEDLTTVGLIHGVVFQRGQVGRAQPLKTDIASQIQVRGEKMGFAAEVGFVAPVFPHPLKRKAPVSGDFPACQVGIQGGDSELSLQPGGQGLVIAGLQIEVLGRDGSGQTGGGKVEGLFHIVIVILEPFKVFEKI